MKEAEAQIKILEYVLESLCKCEICIKGRRFIKKEIKRLKDDISNIKK